MGGVDVYSEYAFTTSKNSEHVMDVQQGINHFDGEEALAFSRERENVPGGDNQRGKNQQAVITAMIKKMISPQMLMKANSIIDDVSGNVEIGYGDSWIISLMGIYLGGICMLEIVVTAFFLTGFVSLMGIVFKKWKNSVTLPFIPFLTAAYLGVFMI